LVGACWAFATTSSISDRIKILRNASTVDINLSPQALLDCGIEKGTGSCDGGSAINAFQFMQVYGITDDSCAPYMAVDYAFMSEYPCEETMCRTCDRLGNCRAIANATKYYVSEYGSVKGETNMMKEIWARGPIGSRGPHGDLLSNDLIDLLSFPSLRYLWTQRILRRLPRWSHH